MKPLRYLAPLALLVLLGLILWHGLGRDPHHIPSPLIGKPVPAFDLPRLRQSAQRLTADTLKGEVSLLNIWATWCTGCYDEHALLVQISKERQIPIYGINYKDDRQLAIKWLQQFGDPYRQIGFDGDGALGLDLGVYGLPETYLLDSEATVIHKHIGPLNAQAWHHDLLPLIKSRRHN